MSRRSAANDYVDREEYHGGANHFPTRPVNKGKAEEELANCLKKATSIDETAPKAKHCIVYTWDYHTSASIWTGLRVLPILSDEVQTFKALVTVHKILQEGHPSTLKEAQQQTGWLETCARTIASDGQRGYAPLIRAYVTLLLAKLKFHKAHRDFNGLFEYAEYVSLRGIEDPNEGYETITDLMRLQDQIDSFQKLIFAHFKGSTSNECRISALVPQVKESYGIYRFITSMLRAMHRRTDAMDALEPLRSRFNAQHYNLRKFYYECANLKYLTSLINVPKLPNEPPNLTDAGDAPDLPQRPSTTKPRSPSPPPRAPSTNVDEQARMLREFEDKKAEQDRLAAEARRLAQQQADAQREFEDAQRRAAEQRARDEEAARQAQQQLYAQQHQQSYEGTRAAELEREIMAMRGQYERDQMMLEQYDRRVKALEVELAGIQQNIAAQLASKDDMIRSLQDQVNLWRNKYEALAKLYTQLRTEHLDMLNRFKQLQLKANSAQEVIDRMERMERDAKAKNLELADMIRERDRARFETDRLKSSHKDELERLRRDLRFAEERAEDATRTKSSEVSGLLAKYNRQINELEEALRSKQTGTDELMRMLDEARLEADRIRAEKDMEIEVLQASMDDTVQRLGDVHATQGATDEALNAQIDTLILDQKKQLNSIVDAILQSCVAKVDDAVYEIESSLMQGNTTATPEYTLSTVERASNNANEFARVFCLFIRAAAGGDQVAVIRTANELATAISDVLINTKGVSRLAPDDKAVDQLVERGRAPGVAAIRAFNALMSFRLEGLGPAQREELAMARTVETRSALAGLTTSLETLVRKDGASSSLANATGEIGDHVEREMMAAAQAIEAATRKLEQLMARPKDASRYSAVDLQVHDAILQASLAITSAIGRLIKCASDSQQEIVREGRGASSAAAFYKKNSRWTEGLLSAAKAVAWSTTLLIETADGVISGVKSLEQLIVASNGVAAATAQLVQASRVKANLHSKTQERLEMAAKAVTEACKALVRQVQAITARQAANGAAEDYSDMTAHDFRMREFEAQVKIQSLDKDLTNARRALAELRRHGYRDEDDS